MNSEEREAIADEAIALFVEALRREGVRLAVGSTAMPMAENEPLIGGARAEAVAEIGAR